MADAVSEWFGIFKEGDPLRKVSNTTRVNRVSRVLGGLKGLGCRIDKPLNGDGSGWTIIVDGSSDLGSPEDTAFTSVDRRFAIGDGDASGTALQKIYGNTADTVDLNSLLVEWDVIPGDSATKSQARFHIPAADTGVVYEVLCRDTAGVIFWANTTDTCS